MKAHGPIPETRALLAGILFATLIAGVILAASLMPFGTSAPSTEAAPSLSIPASTLSRRIFLPIVQVSQNNPGIPASGVYLGAWVKGLHWDISALTTFQNKVGRRMAIVMWYEGWNGRDFFNRQVAQEIANQGSMPIVTWEPWDWTVSTDQSYRFDAKIAAGSFDSYIRSYAQSVKSYGKPVLIRFAHEMNNGKYPWAVGVRGNTSQDYVAAWRRVHNIFTQVGATNVQWVWSPNIKYEGTTPFAEVFPGDDYIDWMGLDGYNGGTALPWGGWLWFSDIFGASYQDLTQMSQKPLMIAEVGSVEQGGSKATWLSDVMLTQLPQHFPRIRAFIWFNEDWYDESNTRADWRIESSSSSLGAYSQAAANSYFKSSYP